MPSHSGRVALALACALGLLVAPGRAEESGLQSGPGYGLRLTAHPVQVVNTPAVRVVGQPAAPDRRPQESPPEPFFAWIPLRPGETRGLAPIPRNCAGRYIVIEQVSGVIQARVPYFSIAATDGHRTWHRTLNMQIFPLPDTVRPGISTPPPAATFSLTWRLPPEAGGLILEIETDHPERTKGGRAFLSGYCVDGE